VGRGPRTPPDRPPALAGRRNVERLIRDLPGAGEIPRKEGELSFREPWEVRTLGIVVQMHQEGHFAWPEFQSELVEVIGEWEAMPPDQRPDWSYYACWEQAAERLIAKKNFVAPEAFDQRAEEFLSGKRTPPHTHGGGLLARDPGSRAGPPGSDMPKTATEGRPGGAERAEGEP
jgi:nitrile hydratase accessory protein